MSKIAHKLILFPIVLIFTFSVFSLPLNSSSDEESEYSESQEGKREKKRTKKSSSKVKKVRIENPSHSPLPHDPSGPLSQPNAFYIPAAAQPIHSIQSLQGQAHSENPVGKTSSIPLKNDDSDEELKEPFSLFPEMKFFLGKRSDTESQIIPIDANKQKAKNAGHTQKDNSGAKVTNPNFHAFSSANQFSTADEELDIQGVHDVEDLDTNYLHRPFQEIEKFDTEISDLIPKIKTKKELESLNQNNPFVALPFDIINIIFKYLSIYNQVYLSETCRKFNVFFRKVDEISLERMNLLDDIIKIIADRGPFLKKIILKDMKNNHVFTIAQMEELYKKISLNHLTHFENINSDSSFLFDFCLNFLSGNDVLPLQRLLLRVTYRYQIKITQIDNLTKSIESGRLENLTHLDLSGVVIDQIKVKEILQAIKAGRLNKLTDLNLSRKKLGIDEVSIFVEAIKLGRLDNLTHLDISHCFNSDDTSASCFITLLQSMAGRLIKLTHLDLEGNIPEQLGYNVMRSFVNLILSGCFDNLKFLGLAFISFDIVSVKLLSDALQTEHLKNLTHLNLEYCNLDNDSIELLARTFETGKLSNLTHLNLSNSLQKINDQVLRLLLNGIKKGKIKLKSFNLAFNDFQAISFQAFADAIQLGYFEQLNELYLYECGLGGEVVIELAKAIQTNKLINLNILDLSVNRIGAKGFKVFFELLKNGHLKNLTSLDLSCTAMKTEDLKLLAKALSAGNLKSLAILNLSDNDIKPGGFRPLFECVKKDCLENLTELFFNGNDILEKDSYDEDLYDQDFRVIATVIRLGYLKRLDFRATPISKNGILELARAICSRGLRNYIQLELDSDNNEDPFLNEVFNAIEVGDLKALKEILKYD